MRAMILVVLLLAGCSDPTPEPPEWVTQEDER